MIALSPDPTHPEDENRRVYFPLHFSAEKDLWVAIPDALSGCAHEIEAAQVCAQDLRKQWRELTLHARTLRALCDHPQLSDFEGDGIDADMLRHSARSLSLVIHRVGENVTQLLEYADVGHKILIGTTRYRLNDATGLIEPQP